MEGRLVLLSGERASGKTTVCQQATSLAQREGLTCGGLLTLPRGDLVLDVVDVRNGDVRRLTVPAGTAGAVQQGRFHFDPRALSWGNETLAAATPCDLLVIDELGPLEIERGRGWSKAFDVLRRADYALAVVVVRPQLLARTQLKLPPGATTVLTITPENRLRRPQPILQILHRQVESREAS
jgi:nucleoside-triphosphatase THEP1